MFTKETLSSITQKIYDSFVAMDPKGNYDIVLKTHIHMMAGNSKDGIITDERSISNGFELASAKLKNIVDYLGDCERCEINLSEEERIILKNCREMEEDMLSTITGIVASGTTSLKSISNLAGQYLEKYFDNGKKTQFEQDLELEVKRSKILVVDDYKHSQTIITRILKRNYFDYVTVAGDGKQAIGLIEDMLKTKEKYDLIIMDLQMPTMNGFDATKSIRSSIQGYENIPIIGLSALAMKGDKEKALEAGCTDYVTKPIEPNELREKVNYYLTKAKEQESQ